MRLPKGFGWRYAPGDQWVLNHMIHNLLPNRDRVYVTYTLDFIPDTSPAAKDIRQSRPSGSTSRAARPTRCSTSTAAAAANGRFTYPDDAPNAYGGGAPRNSR